MTAMVLFLMVLNFGISWFNAHQCGMAWIESKAIGGFTRFIVWCGAVMSACGFTWVYLIAIVFMGQAAEPAFMGEGFKPQDRIFTDEVVQGSLALGYLVLIGPIIGSGLGITAHSIGQAWKRRTLGSMGVAGWNSFAQVYNTYQAISAIPDALSIVGEAFSSKKSSSSSSDSKGKGGVIIVVLVVVALLGGVLTTAAIIRSVASRRVRELDYERLAARNPGREVAV